MRWRPVRIDYPATRVGRVTTVPPSSAQEHPVIDAEALPYTPGAVGSTIPGAQRGAIHMEASYGLGIKEGSGAGNVVRGDDYRGSER